MELEIRLASKSDIPELSRLLLQILRVHHEGRPDIFRYDGAKYTPDELEKIIDDEKRPIFAGTLNGEFVGYAFCIEKDTEDTCREKRKVLYLDDLCVDEKHRNEGIGSRLMDYVIEYSRSNGFDAVELNVWECNPEAVEFYKNRDFKVQSYKMELPII